MAGISGIGAQAPVRSISYAPSVEGVGVQAGGGSPRRMDGDSFTSVIRMGTPLYKVGLEHVNVGFLGKLFGRGGAGGTMAPGLGTIVSEGGLSLGGASGGIMGGAGGGVGGAISGIGGALKQGLGMFVGALKSNFLISAAVSGVTNLVDVVRGQTTPKKALATFAADTAVYTGIGATSTMIGAALGSLIPIPFVGTALGIAAGMGLGFLYEKTIRQGMIRSAGNAMFKQDVG